MATRTRKTSKPAESDVAEVLYNEGEVQHDFSDIEEMRIDEVRALLESTDWSAVKDRAGRPPVNPTAGFNLILPEKDFSSLLERLHALERAFTEGSKGQKAETTPMPLTFTREELGRYTTHRIKGLAPKSQDWIRRADKRSGWLPKAWFQKGA